MSDNKEDVKEVRTGSLLFNCGSSFKPYIQSPKYIPPPTPVEEFQTKATEEKATFTTGSVRGSNKGRGRFDLISFAALESLAQLLERGAELYGENNWRKGQPLSRYLNSAARHLYQLIDSRFDEDHAAAVLFNIMAYIHTRKAIMAVPSQLPKELDDIGHTNVTN